ncbi:MAG: hypothetical protein JW938_02810, partial [Candidatus Omnitrophica bacterium]|nr:hypothetical protein [Candidatus Omnitrophota bacterium]
YDIDASSATASNELNIGDMIYGDIASDYVGIGVRPSSALNVAGDMTTTGTFIFGGSVDAVPAYNAIDTNALPTVPGDMGAADDLYIAGDLSVDGTIRGQAGYFDTIDTSGDVVVNGNLSIGGDTTISGVLFSDDYTLISNDLTVIGAIGSQAFMRSPIYYAGSTKTYFLEPANAGTSLSIAGAIALSGGQTISSDGARVVISDDLSIAGQLDAASGATLALQTNNSEPVQIGSTSLDEGSAIISRGGDLKVFDDLDVHDDVSIGGNISVAGSLSVSENVAVEGSLSVGATAGGGQLIFSNGEEINNLVDGVLQMLGDVTSSGTFVFGGSTGAVPTYNAIDGDGTISPASTLMNASNDLYVEGDIEVGSSVTIAQSLTVNNLFLTDGTAILASQWDDAGDYVYEIDGNKVWAYENGDLSIGGMLTLANNETIDNAIDGVLAITAPSTLISNNLTVYNNLSVGGKLFVDHAGAAGITDMAEVEIGNTTAHGSAQVALYENSDSATRDGFKMRYNSSADGVTNKLEFLGHAAGADQSVAMAIDRDTGYVGVGTTTGDTNFTVLGNTSMSGNLSVWGNLSVNGSFQVNTGTFDKITVTTIDPVYKIGDVKYATYGGETIKQWVEVIGQAELVDGMCIIDLKAAEKGSDLWLFYQAVKAKTIIPFVTAYGPSLLYAYMNYEDGACQLIVKAYDLDPDCAFSYRLMGRRLDLAAMEENVAENQGVTAFIDVDKHR